ncbi:SET and MYND domain-containing protein 4-like isoform X2 [Haliotis rubra]|uniref:SET and MYND domain-containing protein 4-like isoform X2 n=1 Tax=Haliotis rubra TaxID=36100 RepID=UPI001EE4EBF1|nr:SET and MYND domain-containing protein 4-like isoform X2 [Haliotis rubra]
MASNFGNWQCAIDNLTTTAKSDGCLKSFFNLDNNYKRIAFIHKKNFINDVAWLPLYWDNCHSMLRKSTEKAVRYRDDGNKYFQKKQYKSAIQCYTKSIQHASTAELQQNQAFALGLGNRSAALFYLKQYQACLGDITMALTSGCPCPTADRLKIRKIHCLVNLGRGQEAQQAIRDFKKHLSGHTDTEKKVKDKLEDDIASLEHQLSQNWLGEPDGQTDRQLPQLFQGPSEVITQASLAVEMKHTCSKGRHLVAKQAIPAGATLIVERPYAAVLLQDHLHSHCHNCFQTLSLAPIPVECRDTAWTMYHNIECQYQDLLSSVGIAHLSLRIILTAGLQFLLAFSDQDRDSVIRGLTVGPKYQRDYLAVHDLLTHEQDMEAEDLFQYSLTAYLLLRVLIDVGWLPDGASLEDELTDNMMCIGSFLLRHILQLVCNAHAISELQVSQVADSNLVDSKSQVRVATAIYPTASLINHSCDPTIIASFQRDTLVVRSVKDVAVGQEIFNCYGPHCKRMSLTDRQQALSSQYFFHCQCQACVQEEQSIQQDEVPQCPACGVDQVSAPAQCPVCLHNSETLASDTKQADRLFQQGLDRLQQMDIAGAIVSFSQCVELRERSMDRHQTPLCEARDCLARCHAMTGQFSLASKYLELNLSASELKYGDSSIELGYELQKLAQVFFNDKQVGKALNVIDRALGILTIHFGKNSGNEDIEELVQMKSCLIEYQAGTDT